jgi:outer membrane autotransporter protein
MGSIGGGVTNSGTVKPGGSSATGTLAVGGNYTQTSTGNLRIGLASTSTYGRLRVGGTANLGGSLTAVSVNGFHPSAGDSFTILTATGGVNGKFGTVNDLTGAKSTSLLKFEVVYDPNDVKLTYVQGTVTGLLDSFTGECRDHVTPNQRSVAAALDDVIDNHKLSKLFKYLDKDIGCDQILSDLDRIAPEEISSIYNLAAELETVQMQNIQRRTEAIRSGAGGFSAAGLAVNGGGPSYSGPIGFRTGMDSPANNEPVAFRTGVAGPNGDDGKESKEMKQVAPYDPRMGVFLTGVGQWINVGDTFNARGFDLTTGGFTLGLDYKLTPNLAVGITAGYANTSVDLNNGGDIDVNGGKLGLYATYFTGGFYVDTAVTGGYNSYDTRRSALQGDARGSTDGGELNVLVATGYDVHVGGLTFGPTASFQYTYTGLSGFTETGSLAPLTYDSQSKESYRTAFGAKASYDWKVGGVIIKPEVSLAWQHEFGDSSYGVDSRFAVAGGNFSVFGPEVGRDSLLLDAGVAIQWNERTSTYVYYTGDLGRTNEQANSVSGGVTVAF